MEARGLAAAPRRVPWGEGGLAEAPTPRSGAVFVPFPVDASGPPERKDMGVDWKMFREEMKRLKPMPPLVFNLELLDSARKHSYYMVHNGLGHTEEAGKKGFTGATPAGAEVTVMPP